MLSPTIYFCNTEYGHIPTCHHNIRFRHVTKCFAPHYCCRRLTSSFANQGHIFSFFNNDRRGLLSDFGSNYIMQTNNNVVSIDANDERWRTMCRWVKFELFKTSSKLTLRPWFQSVPLTINVFEIFLDSLFPSISGFWSGKVMRNNNL